MFDSGQDVELTDDMNPHDVACLLKEFFRSLPEPLLTRDLYHPFLATRSKPSYHQMQFVCTRMVHVTMCSPAVYGCVCVGIVVYGSNISPVLYVVRHSNKQHC